MEKMKECKEIEKLLISIDMVNGFVKEGNMADSYIQHIVPEHIKLIKQIQEKGGMIAFVKECHKENCREFNQYPAHCIEGTEEAELIEELKPFEKDAFVYLKNLIIGAYCNVPALKLSLISASTLQHTPTIY